MLNMTAREKKHQRKQKKLQKAQENQRQAKNDQRLGSKKPIALTKDGKLQVANKPKKVDLQPKVKVVKSKAVEVKSVAPKISPEKELAAIENDDHLNDLLEQLETEEVLSKEDQAWVDKQMQRHQALMKQLGWIDDEGEEDLLQQFEDASSALDEFK